MRQASSQTRYSSLQTPVTSEDLTGVPPSLLQHVLVDQLDCINPVLAPTLPILIGWNSSKISRHSNVLGTSVCVTCNRSCSWALTVCRRPGCRVWGTAAPWASWRPAPARRCRGATTGPPSTGSSPRLQDRGCTSLWGARDRDESWGFRVTSTCKLSLFI